MFEVEKEYYNQLIINLNTNKEIVVDEFLDCKKIAIFRTIWWKTFTPVLEKLASDFKNKKIYVIGREEDQLEIDKFKNENMELLIVKGEEPFHIDNLELQISYLQKEGIDLVSFIIGGKGIFSYRNMFDIMNKFYNSKKVILNREYRFLNYELVEQEKNLVDQYNSLCDWFWDNVPQVNEIDSSL